METIRCADCGALLMDETTECPKCGCPINYSQSKIRKKENAVIKSNSAENRKSALPILSLIIGIIIILFGVMLLSQKSNIEIYDAKEYDVDDAVFGADFYTEIYNASDTIVDELNDINSGIAIISNSFIFVIEAIYFSCGIVVIALGLGVVAISLININKSKNGIR